MAARDQPSGIEPTVGLAVIRQPVVVPMADEGRIGGIDGRAAADENVPVRKTRQHISRPVGGMNLDDVAVLEGEARYGGERAVTHDEHVPARQLEETLDIGDIFAAAIALPRQTAAEAELTAATDGNDCADFGDLHEDPRHAFSVSSDKYNGLTRKTVQPFACHAVPGKDRLLCQGRVWTSALAVPSRSG
jgi:hypothetical protein